MKQIFLLRHAKSSRDLPGIADIDRPLNQRGRDSATAMARHLLEHSLRPDLILCSPSRRTRETLDHLAPAVTKVPVSFVPDIYEASAATLLGLLSNLPADTGSVMMIGHNPGTQRLALMLASGTRRNAEIGARMARKFPTCALAILSSRIGKWASLKPEGCSLQAFVIPADL